MTTRKIPGRGGSGSARISSGRARLRILLALPAAPRPRRLWSRAAQPGLPLALRQQQQSGCGGREHGEDRDDDGVTVLTNSKGFTLYSFGPDTPTTSKCNGTCAQNWPPVNGPVTAARRHGHIPAQSPRAPTGSTQATFDGHPLYTFAGDTAPGQAKGNGLNTAGGLWHEITTSGTAAPAPAGSSSPGSGGGGYGY